MSPKLHAIVRIPLFMLAASPAIAFAGVVTPATNPFVQNASRSETPSSMGTPPPAPPVLPALTHQTPPPPMNPVPGASATGFKTAPAGYSTPPKRIGALPPPLPVSDVQHNASISQQGATSDSLQEVPPPVVVHASTSLRRTYIKGRNVVHSAFQQIDVGPHSLANVVVDLSGYAPNMLYTPFHHPNIIYTDLNAIHWSALGSKAIVAVEARHPVGAILTGQQPGDPAIALTFVPQKIPGRNYQVHIQGWQPNPEHTSTPLPDSARSMHFLAVMKAATLGEVPHGYMRSNHLPVIQYDGPLKITPYARFIGASHDLIEYRVRNTSASSLTLSENNFYRPGVTAVAFWPGGKLYGHGHTRLFILQDQTHHHHDGMIGFVGKD